MKVYMRKRRSRIVPVAIIAMMMAVVFVVPAGVFGGEYDEEGNRIDARVTEYFNVDIDVHENNSYDFTERVGTVFNTPGHGIFRYIPKTWDGIDEDVAGGWCSSDDLDAYTKKYAVLTKAILDSPLIQGYCYTQLTDVENEENGLLTYRRDIKIPLDTIRKINEGTWEG